MRIDVIRRLIRLLAFAAGFAGLAHAQPDSQADTLEAYVDGVVSMATREDHVAGLSLSVVRDGKVRLVKGYGYADVEAETPVDPYLHSFRIGSVTKTFTYTAIMQLAERGEIDLQADVNDYLTSFKIPEAYGEPVRIRDLMTHRSGFDVVTQDLFVAKAEDFPSLEDWLKDNLPARVRPPGEVTSYDNYGAALAGLIVENVSGLSFEDYVARNILEPLGMSSTTVRQKLGDGSYRDMDPALAGNMARTYHWRGGAFRPFMSEIINAPAGSMSSTAPDMARYMLAHLGDGAGNGERILAPETARSMRARPYPGRPGADYAHGFRTWNLAGYETFEHTGSTLTSDTSMVMLPDLKLGVFVAINGGAGYSTPSEVSYLIAKKLIGDAARAPAPSMALTAPENFTGRYLTTRRYHEAPDTVRNMGGAEASVRASGEGRLIISDGNRSDEYRRIGERLFERVGGDFQIAFDLDSEGRAVRFYGPYGHASYERMQASFDPKLFSQILWLAVIAAAVQVVAFWKRLAGGLRSDNAWSTRLSVVTLSTAGLVLAMIFFLRKATGEFARIGVHAIFSWPNDYLKIFLGLALLLSVFTAAMVAGLYPAFARARFSALRKLHYAAFTAVLVILLWALANWNLIGTGI